MLRLSEAKLERVKGIESSAVFRDIAFTCVNIGDIPRRIFLLTNQNASKRTFPVRNCQEFLLLTDSPTTYHTFRFSQCCPDMATAMLIHTRLHRAETCTWSGITILKDDVSSLVQAAVTPSRNLQNLFHSGGDECGADGEELGIEVAWPINRVSGTKLREQPSVFHYQRHSNDEGENIMWIHTTTLTPLQNLYTLIITAPRRQIMLGLKIGAHFGLW